MKKKIIKNLMKNIKISLFFSKQWYFCLKKKIISKTFCFCVKIRLWKFEEDCLKNVGGRF